MFLVVVEKRVRYTTNQNQHKKKYSHPIQSHTRCLSVHVNANSKVFEFGLVEKTNANRFPQISLASNDILFLLLIIYYFKNCNISLSNHQTLSVKRRRPKCFSDLLCFTQFLPHCMLWFLQSISFSIRSSSWFNQATHTENFSHCLFSSQRL